MKKARTQKTKRCLVCTTILLLAFGVGVSAEDSSLYTLEDMLVTAMKREQNLLDAPVAVQNFAGDLVEVMHLSNAFDLADQIPGAYASKPSQPDHRGDLHPRRRSPAHSKRAAPTGIGPPASMSMIRRWCTPIISGFHRYPCSDLERVEVLRGPQGTTYGRGVNGRNHQIHHAQPRPRVLQRQTAVGPPLRPKALTVSTTASMRW